MKRFLLLCVSFVFSASVVAIEAETAEDSCGGIMRLVEKGDHKEALEEARWCVEALESVLQGSVSEHFEAEVAGWRRTDIREESAMGMSSIIGEYRKGDTTLVVTLIGGQGSGSILGGALGGLAQMGLMQSGKRFRVQRLKASVDAQGQITVNLDDGSFISVKSPQYNTQEEALDALEPFLDAFPFAKINETRA